MKRNSLVFLLLLVSYTAFSQKVEDDQNELREIFLSLPDSVLSNNLFDFSKVKGHKLWELYNKEEFQRSNTLPTDRIFGYLDILFRNDTIKVNSLIEVKSNLIRIMEPYSDAIPTYDIKLFKDNQQIVAVTLKSSDHATTHTDEIVFYKYKNENFKDVTYKVLKSFNYFTDNYSDSTINILNSYYNCDLRGDDVTNKGLLYTFTNSDTVIISESFFDYFIDPNENPGFDEEYFDGEFFTKKYIMDKGKLRLAE